MPTALRDPPARAALVPDPTEGPAEQQHWNVPGLAAGQRAFPGLSLKQVERQHDHEDGQARSAGMV